MTRRLWIVAVLAVWGCGVLAAADKPDFSGTWNINAEKSNFGPMPPPAKMVRKIEHKDPLMRMTSTQVTPNGERSSDVTFTIDGTEQTVKIGPAEVKITPAWVDKVLNVVTKHMVQGVEIRSTDKWALSADGKVMTVDSVINTPQGDLTIKLVMDKQ